jgi:DUF4097 and DUF4098 domain-containing protein YvlB
MKEEKMMILSMLEEGKITSEEAIKLMEALEDMEIPREHNEFKEEKDNRFKDRKFSKPIFNTLEDIGTDIGNALSTMFDSLKDMGNSFSFMGNYETITTDLDMDISHIENPSLDLKAVNGNIRLRSNDEDKLFIKSTCQYKNGIISQNEPYFDFYMDGDKVIFTPKYNSNISIKLDVSLPEKHYNEIILTSSNGKIDIEELSMHTLRCTTTNSSIDVVEINSNEIDLTTKNGRIECRDTSSDIIKAATTNSNIFLMDIHCSEIDAKTANAKIGINDIDAQKIICKTSNASIEAEDITCDIIHLITSNGKITCDDIDVDRAKEIKLMTSNGSISSEIYEANNDSYFDLETSMGNITLDIPNIVYKLNKQANLGFKKIIAHSVNFDENREHLNFIASTSNGSIKIY